jgi:hypothetical protein
VQDRLVSARGLGDVELAIASSLFSSAICPVNAAKSPSARVATWRDL